MSRKVGSTESEFAGLAHIKLERGDTIQPFMFTVMQSAMIVYLYVLLLIVNHFYS